MNGKKAKGYRRRAESQSVGVPYRRYTSKQESNKLGTAQMGYRGETRHLVHYCTRAITQRLKKAGT